MKFKTVSDPELSSTRIEGHQPSPKFLADMEALITGQLDAEEVRRRIITRGREADQLASALKTKA